MFNATDLAEAVRADMRATAATHRSPALPRAAIVLVSVSLAITLLAMIAG